MSKKMVFLNTDKMFYIATYTDNGDFSSLSEKGYETAGQANESAGFPEGTPTGELVQDSEVVEAQAPAPTVEPTPTEVVEEKVAELVADVVAEPTVSTETEVVEPVAPVAPETTEPVVPAEEVKVEETVPTEPAEVVAPVEPTEPAVVA